MIWRILGVMLVLSAEPAAAQSIGTVEEVQSVAYGTPPAGSRAALSVRRPVVQDERIETAADGAVGMRFVDDTVFRVGPDSSVLLDTYAYNPRSQTGTVALALAKGGFRYVSGKMSKAGVQVVTPTVTLGVRGTDFAVIVYPTGVTDVFVFEGSVDMRPAALAVGTILAVGQYGRAVSANQPVQVFGPPASDRRGFIGINDIDRRIAGFRPFPDQQNFPDRPLFNPIPAIPQPPMQPPMGPPTSP